MEPKFVETTTTGVIRIEGVNESIASKNVEAQKEDVVGLELRATDDLLHEAWVIIANAGEGNWERESEEWQAAAKTFRDRHHAYFTLKAAEPTLVAGLQDMIDRYGTRGVYTILNSLSDLAVREVNIPERD